jgi:hypothetical protein
LLKNKKALISSAPFLSLIRFLLFQRFLFRVDRGKRRRFFLVERYVLDPLGRYVAVRINGLYRAFSDAGAAVNAYVRVNNKHIGILAESFHRANDAAEGITAIHARFTDDMRHKITPFEMLNSVGNIPD